MANQSVITLEKPLQHLGLDDWHGRINQLRNVAEEHRNEAFNLRHAARTLRNETKIKSDWETYHNNSRLAERIAELNQWRITVETCLERVDREMRILREEKASTERELEAMVTPLVVVSECLSMRDTRLGTELTFDDADTELKRELCVVENNQRILRDQCQAAWEKLNRLEEVRLILGLEIVNKKEAEEIDISQMNLTKFSASITQKPEATRIPKNSFTYEGWLEHTQNIKRMADSELADTYTIRESLFVAREKARNILKAQQDKTEHTIRKRIFETQKARNELEWQKKKMNEEMQKCLMEIRTLEQAFNDKNNVLKLAETRLENRAQRSGKELCNDEVYYGLCAEVLQLRKIKETLANKIAEAKATQNALEEHTLKIDADLNNKEHTLMTDIRALDLRDRLKTGEFVPKTQTDRNLQLGRYGGSKGVERQSNGVH